MLNLDLNFDIVFTSELKRAQNTAKIILENLEQWDELKLQSKITNSFNLNERDYGEILQALIKKKQQINLVKTKYTNGDVAIQINHLMVKALRML